MLISGLSVTPFGKDRIWGEEGNDAIYGDLRDMEQQNRGAKDYLYGGPGDDSVWGGGGHDQIYGDDGMDNLRGGSGMDRIIGGRHDDRLAGEQGNDILIGLGGNDTYEFTGENLGHDRIKSVHGVNWLDLDQHGYETSLDLGSAATQHVTSQLDLTLPSSDVIDHVNARHGEKVDFKGNHLDNWIRFSGPGSTMEGLGGDDQYVYSAKANHHRVIVKFNGWNLGTDGLFTSAIAHLDFSGLEGGKGLNSHVDVYGGSRFMVDGELAFTTNAKVQLIRGTEFDDEIRAGTESVLIHGGAGDDRLYGGSGNDVLIGAEGHDHLFGKGGDDKLWGGGGRDSLFGGDGSDELQGFGGSDRYLVEQEDDVIGLAGDDVVIRLEDSDLAWTDDEVEKIDEGLGRLHEKSHRLLNTRYGQEVTLVRKRQGEGDCIDALACNLRPGNDTREGRIEVYNAAFRSLLYTPGETMVHEMAHHWEEDEYLRSEFEILSAWLHNPTGDPDADPYEQPGADEDIDYVLSGDRNWWHDREAVFAESYGKQNPSEDIATCFRLYCYEDLPPNPPTSKLLAIDHLVSQL